MLSLICLILLQLHAAVLASAEIAWKGKEALTICCNIFSVDGLAGMSIGKTAGNMQEILNEIYWTDTVVILYLGSLICQVNFLKLMEISHFMYIFKISTHDIFLGIRNLSFTFPWSWTPDIYSRYIFFGYQKFFIFFTISWSWTHDFYFTFPLDRRDFTLSWSWTLATWHLLYICRNVTPCTFPGSTCTRLHIPYYIAQTYNQMLYG